MGAESEEEGRFCGGMQEECFLSEVVVEVPR